MSLPKAVQEMSDKTDQIQSDIQHQIEGKTGGDKPAAPARQQETDATKNQQPDRQNKGDSGSKNLQAEYDALDQRYRSYKKMYDQEVHGFRTTLAEKDAKIDKLTADLSAIKKQIEDLQKRGGSAQSNDVDDEQLDHLRQEYGPEFVEAVGTLSRTQLMGEYAKLSERIERLEQSGSGGQQATSFSSESNDRPETTATPNEFFNRLSTLVPNWQKVNGTPGFSDFLELPDENGSRRQDNLAAAQRNGNVIDVARHFLDYADYQQASRTSAEGDYLPGDYGAGANIGDDFDDDDIVYEDELETFYRNQSLGKYSLEEEKRLEAKINNALQKGLIRSRRRAG